ncbi:MAG: HrpE/YscL family type III secretion apparatus protein [Waddliaceae bacterium]
MSNRLFSLIQDGKIELTPGKKHIPAEEFSILLSASELVTKTQDDADLFRTRVIKQCETIKEQAKQEGFEEGFNQWTAKLTELEKETRKVRSDVEKMVLKIALKAAKKILARELELSKSAVVDIIKQSLKPIAQHKYVTIHVNPSELEVIEENRGTIKEVFESLEALSIRPNREVGPGGCIIETEGGIINAQLENQWMILENAFQKFADNNKENHD